MSTGDPFAFERGRFLDGQQDPAMGSYSGSPRPPTARSGPSSSQQGENRRVSVMKTLYQQKDKKYSPHYTGSGRLLARPSGGSGQLSFRSDDQTGAESNDDSALPVFGNSPVQQSPSNLRPHRQHTYMYSMFNPNSNKPQAEVFKIFISICILVSVVSFIIDTMPHGSDLDMIFFLIEGITSTIFAVEYVLRLYLITQNHHYSHPLWGRLRYSVSLPAVIDLVSWMPFFLELGAQGVNGPFEHRGSSRVLPNLMVLKSIRILRILKTRRVSHAMGVLGRVLGHNREVMTVSVVLCGGLMLIQATMLYYFKPPESSNPECSTSDFESIPATMYMSILMITTLRAPSDGCDYPWYTKLLISANAITSVAMLAIPTSMLTWGFEAEAERVAQKLEKRERYSTADGWPRERSQECDSSSSSSSSDELDDDDIVHDSHTATVRNTLTTGFPSGRISLPSGTTPRLDPSPRDLSAPSPSTDLLKMLIEEIRAQRSEISQLQQEVQKLSKGKKPPESGGGGGGGSRQRNLEPKDGNLLTF